MLLYVVGQYGNIGPTQLKTQAFVADRTELSSSIATIEAMVPHIFAVGDVIGFPALASTSMDQDRVAISRIFDLKDAEHLDEYLPFGIYVPEVLMVGLRKKNVEAKGIFSCSGRA